ncbi:MAG TPA: outer membrane protein assembly factor BamD [Gammaproteobacteria bacterium]|nr:outer membrane protein assembly factor BamD [Gammaproteobacteria bacterium]
MLRLLPVLILLLFLSACATVEEEDPTAGQTAAEIYRDAHEYLNEGEYESAIQFFERLESRFPYGPYAEQAQLEIAYTYYKSQEYESAIMAAERFIKLHPDHRSVDYAYYLRGLARYDGDQSFMARWFNQDLTERDPRSMREAFRYFSQLVSRFPDSRYARDAIHRMQQLREGLAKYELHVANYYIKRNAFVAAANRAQYVVKNYQGTQAIPEALSIMVTSYTELGLPELARDSMRVLAMNYPDYRVE